MQKNRSKWDNVWIMCCSRDFACASSAQAYQKWYGVPDDHFFWYIKNDPLNETRLPIEYQSAEQRHMANMLAQATRDDKLLVICHGGNNQIYMQLGIFYSGEEFGKLLHLEGLREIGLISIKACQFGLGKGPGGIVKSFEHMGGKVGTVKGYMKETITYRPIINRHFDRGKPRELVVGPGRFAEYKAKLASCLGRVGNDSGRYKKVHGSLYTNSSASDMALERREANEPHLFIE